MALPTFESFSLQDTNFITERITFKGFADRSVIRGNINRREGIKFLASEFGEKEITVQGNIIATTAAELQSLIDGLKKKLTTEEGSLIIETGRTFTATVGDLAVADEHYNQSKAPFEITFICTDPFAVSTQESVGIDAISGTTTISGTVNISGTLFSRPTLTYTPPTDTGDTLITGLTVSHIPSGQSVTVTGFGSGGVGGLGYQNAVTINFDTFTSLEGSSDINNSGAFPRWEPGDNEFTVTTTGGPYPGGALAVVYSPRYL